MAESVLPIGRLPSVSFRTPSPSSSPAYCTRAAIARGVQEALEQLTRGNELVKMNPEGSGLVLLKRVMVVNYAIVPHLEHVSFELALKLLAADKKQHCYQEAFCGRRTQWRQSWFWLP